MKICLRLAGFLLPVFLVAACAGDGEPPATPTALGFAPFQPLTPRPTETLTPLRELTPTPFPPASLIPITPGTTLVLASYLYDTQDGAFYRIAGHGGGVWSPDSRALASSLCCAGDGFIEVLDIAKNRSFKIEAGDVTRVAWSPDGTQIAFVVGTPPDEAGVYVVNRDGSGNQRILAREGVAEVRWLSTDSLAISAGEGLFPPEPDAFFKADLRTGAINELTETQPPLAEDPRIIFGQPFASGAWVAYDDGGATFVWNRDTAESRQVAEGPAAVVWSPARDRLLVATFPEGEPVPAWQLIDLELGTAQFLPEVGFWAQWLPDGVRLIHAGIRCFQGTLGPLDVFLVDTVEGKSRAMTFTPEVLEWHLLASPTQPVAAYHILQPARRLNLLNLDSGAEEVLVEVSDPENPLQPVSWSPDGRYLLFHYGGGTGMCE